MRWKVMYSLTIHPCCFPISWKIFKMRDVRVQCRSEMEAGPLLLEGTLCRGKGGGEKRLPVMPALGIQGCEVPGGRPDGFLVFMGKNIVIDVSI
jgi:hypothetical protein